MRVNDELSCHVRSKVVYVTKVPIGENQVLVGSLVRSDGADGKRAESLGQPPGNGCNLGCRKPEWCQLPRHISNNAPRIHEHVGRLGPEWADEVVDFAVVNVRRQQQAVTGHPLVSQLEGAGDGGLHPTDVGGTCIWHERVWHFSCQLLVEPGQVGGNGWVVTQQIWEKRCQVRVLLSGCPHEGVPERPRARRGQRGPRNEGSVHAIRAAANIVERQPRLGHPEGPDVVAHTEFRDQAEGVVGGDEVQKEVVSGWGAEGPVEGGPERLVLHRREYKGRPWGENQIFQPAVVIHTESRHQLELVRKTGFGMEIATDLVDDVVFFVTARDGTAGARLGPLEVQTVDERLPLPHVESVLELPGHHPGSVHDWVSGLEQEGVAGIALIKERLGEQPPRCEPPL